MLPPTRPPRSTWPPLPRKTRRVGILGVPAGGWQHVRAGVRGSYVERHYLGALDRSHRLSVRWERAHWLGLVLTLYTANLNIVYSLRLYWCAILGLNQLMLFAGPVVDYLR